MNSETFSRPQISNSIFSTSAIESNDSSNFLDSLKNTNIITWALIILVLAFLGFNIFTYLEKGTEGIIKVFEPIITKIFGTTLELTSKVVDVSAEGAKTVVGVTADTVITGLNDVQDLTPTTAKSSIRSGQISQQQVDMMQQSSLNKALNSAAQTPEQQHEYEASNSDEHNSEPHSGWCYIGSDRGFRSCANVNDTDVCMSGNIFPSKEICINPSLRA